MPAELLWINKNATSKHLSRSSGPADSGIRRHVQTRQSRAPYPQSGCKDLIKMGAVGSTLARQDRAKEPAPSQVITINPPRMLSPTIVPLSEFEVRGLEYYVYRTATECAGWQDDYFWSRLVIQAGSMNPGIIHALISVATWHEESTEARKSGELSSASTLSGLQWEKALVFGRSSAKVSYSTSLIHCVVLACLQAHRGRFQDVRLLLSASAMLRELDEPTCHVPVWERELINTQVRPLVDRLHCRICSICDSSAALRMSVISQRPLQCQDRRNPSVPGFFKTLRDARDCLELILDYARDHISSSDGDHSTNTLARFYYDLDAQICAWNDALNALSFVASNQAIALLRLASLHGGVLIKTCMASSEMTYDTHTPQFREMIDIITSHDLALGTHSTISFGIDSGLIDIVAFIASRCREPTIRRSAIAWLQTGSRVEGDRPSLESAQIASIWMQLEEKDLMQSPVSAHDVPETSRWRLIQGARYHGSNLVRLCFEKFPFAGVGDIRTVDIRFGKCDSASTQPRSSAFDWTEHDIAPDVMLARGGASFLQQDGSYYHMHIGKFYFPIPKV